MIDESWPPSDLSARSRRVLARLCDACRRRGPICLFTGAGVSFTRAKGYETPGWWGLLQETHARIYPDRSDSEQRERFTALRAAHPQPWDVATTLARQAGGTDRLLFALRRVLVGRTGADARYKRLPGKFLDQAATLNAVIAFCSRLRAIRANPCLVPNPRVRAVLTLNYDWFLEGGATQKYNASPFKPLASLRSREIPGRLPVYHIHGYVPHGIRRRPRYPLVLTRGSYERAYRSGRFARETIDRFLRRFTTLFVGVSFNDERLLERLDAMAGTSPPHYALMKRSERGNPPVRRLARAGVRPLLYRSHDDVPAILGRVYLSAVTPNDRDVGLESREGRQVGSRRISPRDYWTLLLFNKR